MGRRFGSALLITAVIAAAGTVRGQTPAGPPTLADVQALLESSALKDQAWGAWWAATLRSASLEPALSANLRASMAPERTDTGYWNQFVRDATLDALVQLGQNDLPPDVLTAVSAVRPFTAVILAAQSRQPPQALDDFLRTVLSRHRSGWLSTDWLAAADLLLLHGSAGLVPATLRDITFAAYVVMADASVALAPYRTTASDWKTSGPGHCLLNVGGYGSDWAGSTPPRDYPPWTNYDLVSVDDQRGTIFIQGPTPERSLAYLRSAGGAGPGRPVSNGERLEALVAAAPGVTVPTIEGAVLVVPWHGDASFRAASDAFHRELQQRYALLVTRLRDAGLLSAADSAAVATPNLHLVVRDCRTVGKASGNDPW